MKYCMTLCRVHNKRPRSVVDKIIERMDLSTVLQNTLSPDHATRQHASATLENAVRTAGLASYLSTLINLLSSDTQPQAVRIAAGLAAKNALVNRRDAVKQAEQAQQWLELSAECRASLKNASMQALSLPNLGTTAAQLVAALACLELTQQSWPELIPTLVNNMTSASSTATLKRASVETIGFVCEESDRIGTVLEQHANSILTAVVNGMQQSEPIAVQVASCKALLNSLEFAHSAFSRPNERAFIMQRVCEAAARWTEEDLSVTAFQCLVKIVNLYYSTLSDFMRNGVESLVVSAMRQTSSESVQLQAIEFWSTVCEVELDILERIEDDEHEEADQACFGFAKGALSQLLPALLWLLCQQSDEYGEGAGSSDDWTPAMAAATCLSLLAATVHDDIMSNHTLLSFVQTNLNNQGDWRCREAAAMAFGSCLEGPDHHNMAQLVLSAMPVLITLLTDHSVAVRDTAAWCIGEACRSFVDTISSQPDLLKALEAALLHGLSDRPRVAANCCWAVAHLIEQSADSAMVDPVFFANALQSLLHTATARPDSSEANLRNSAFQALAAIVSSAPESSLPMVQQMVSQFLISQLESLSSTQIVNADDRMRLQELQGHYAAVLQSAIKVLSSDQVVVFADRLMSIILQQCNPMIVSASSRPPTPIDNGTDANLPSSGCAVWEDLLLLMGTLISAVGEHSVQYVEGVSPVLAAALSGAYHLETSLCIIAIIVIGELAQAVKERFAQVSLPFLQLLSSVLSSSLITQSVKPKAISAIGDIALALGAGFCKNQQNLSAVMPILLQAAQVVSRPPGDFDDWDQLDFLVEMRLSLVEAFTCIIQGASEDSTAAQSLSSSIPIILSFIKSIVSLNSTDAQVLLTDSLIKAVIGVLGDTASAFGHSSGPINAALKEPWVAAFISGQRRRRNLPDHIDQVLRWTAGQLTKL